MRSLHGCGRQDSDRGVGRAIRWPRSTTPPVVHVTAVFSAGFIAVRHRRRDGRGSGPASPARPWTVLGDDSFVQPSARECRCTPTSRTPSHDVLLSASAFVETVQVHRVGVRSQCGKPSASGDTAHAVVLPHPLLVGRGGPEYDPVFLQLRMVLVALGLGVPLLLVGPVVLVLLRLDPGRVRTPSAGTNQVRGAVLRRSRREWPAPRPW